MWVPTRPTTRPVNRTVSRHTYAVIPVYFLIIPGTSLHFRPLKVLVKTSIKTKEGVSDRPPPFFGSLATENKTFYQSTLTVLNRNTESYRFKRAYHSTCIL